MYAVCALPRTLANPIPSLASQLLGTAEAQAALDAAQWTSETYTPQTLVDAIDVNLQNFFGRKLTYADELAAAFVTHHDAYTNTVRV